MQPDEVALIRVHDSATDSRARLSFHTSFDKPLAPGAPPRKSIEVRMLVFFPPGARGNHADNTEAGLNDAVPLAPCAAATPASLPGEAKWPLPEALGAFRGKAKLELRFHDVIEEHIAYMIASQRNMPPKFSPWAAHLAEQMRSGGRGREIAWPPLPASGP